MKVDSTQHGRRCGPERDSVLATAALRLKLLGNRYPSASQLLLSIFDQAVVSGTSFVSVVIIGRLTSPDQLGLYYLVLSIVIIATAVQDHAVSAPYQIYYRRREGRELEEYTGSVWAHHFVLCALSIVCLLAMIAILTLSGHPNMVPGLWVLLGAAPLILLRQAVRRFAFANLRVRSAIILDIVVAIVQLGGFALLGYFGSLNLASIFGVMGGACGLACCGLYWIDPPSIRFVRQRFVPDWRFNWAFAKWALRGYLVGSSAPYIMLWILGLTAGLHAAGVFGACYTLVGITNVLLAGIYNVLTPQSAHAFTTNGASGLRRLLIQNAAILSLTLGGFCVIIAFTGDWLPVAVLGADYQGTGEIFLALAVGVLVSSIGVVAGIGLWAVEAQRSNFLCDVCCMVVTLMTAMFLIPLAGGLGAAVATLAGLSVATVVRLIAIKHYLNCAAMDQRVVASDFHAPVENHARANPASTDDVDGMGIKMQPGNFQEAVT